MKRKLNLCSKDKFYSIEAEGLTVLQLKDLASMYYENEYDIFKKDLV